MGNGGSAKRDHEARMQDARNAHEMAMAKQSAAAAGQAKQAEAEAKERMERIQAQNQENARKHKERLDRLAKEDNQKRREHVEREKARDRLHEKELEKLELDKIEKRKQIEAQEQAHKEAMRQKFIDAKERDRDKKIKQRDDAVNQIRETKNGLNKQIENDKKELIELTQEHKQVAEDLTIQDDAITNFNKSGKLKEERKEMEAAERDYKRDDDEILAAIAKTGQREDNVGRFLKLTHALIGETMASQAQTNKLDAELHTFQTLIERECQDKITIKYLFKEKRLDRFIPILDKQNYKECQDLICEDEEEFKDDILSYIEQDVKKQIEEWRKKHPDEGDPFDLFLEHYKLQKFKKGLNEAGLESLDDINEEDMDKEQIDELIVEANIKGLNKKKFKRAITDVMTGKYKPPESKNDDNKDDDNKDGDDEPKPTEISGREVRILRTICLKADTWKSLEMEKAESTKLALKEVSPLLGGFFSKMHLVIKESQKLLDYSKKLNKEQCQAMEALMTNVKSPKAIEAPKDDQSSKDKQESKLNEESKDSAAPDEDDDDDDITKLPDYEQRKSWREGSECQVYSKENDKWYNGEIIKIFKDSEGEWLEIKYDTENDKRTKQVGRYGKDVRDPVMIECRAIQAAISIDLNVVDIMMPQFEISNTTLRVLPVAQGVEESSKAILSCQSQIRQSVRLAGAILKLKPANLTDISRPLWDAVDDGIIHIIESALEMSKISAQYFGYFLRFNNSFQRFISMNEQNKDISLFTSLEAVREDIDEFSKFKKEFNKKVQKLSDEAMKVIKKCVETHIGAEQFESTRKAREKAKQNYLDKKEIYDKKSVQLDTELETLCDKRANDRSIEAKLATKIKILEESNQRNKVIIDSYTEKEKELLALNFDVGGAFNKQ